MTNVKWSFLGNLVLTQKNHFFGCMIWASKREQTSKDHITLKLIISVSIPGVPEDPFHTILYRIFWRLKWEVSPTYFQIIKLFYKALYYYFFSVQGLSKQVYNEERSYNLPESVYLVNCTTCSLQLSFDTIWSICTHSASEIILRSKKRGWNKLCLQFTKCYTYPGKSKNFYLGVRLYYTENKYNLKHLKIKQCLFLFLTFTTNF